ncbi:hypothetical protein [Ruthenibacterium lactatiformans]|jgi:hypothetical protein|uniref:hypothetical protein n=1 Tax=Ruthenibacterium lactatiformans TaxID=1550024 RepID=UPI0026755B9F|nr:hypothetical protein [Ruthenibacterium lactatiformans]MDY4397094.1 hypothetical protein [Oscillospiraceae bacterium]
MIEKIILDHLAEKLAVPIFMEVPEEAPASFVVLEKTSSSRKNCICTAMMAVQSYAGSLLEAAQLNDQVKQAMDSLPELADIGAARLNSDYNFTDTASKRYRYQAVYDVTHYERR